MRPGAVGVATAAEKFRPAMPAWRRDVGAAVGVGAAVATRARGPRSAPARAGLTASCGKAIPGMISAGSGDLLDAGVTMAGRLSAYTIGLA